MYNVIVVVNNREIPINGLSTYEVDSLVAELAKCRESNRLLDIKTDNGRLVLNPDSVALIIKR